MGTGHARRVLLVRADSGRPVELGALRIDLSQLPVRIRTKILRNRIPFGRLLRDGGVDFVSRPIAFFATTPNSELMGVFWMRTPETLYGRMTELTWHGKRLGEVIEILPPLV